MSTLATYSPNEIDFEIANFKVVGWNSIEVSCNSPRFTFIKGIRGKHTRVHSLDDSLTITLHLLQTSITNDVLNSIIAYDIDNGTGRCKIALIDKSGNTEIRSNNAYVEELPALSFNEEVGETTWKIICLDIYQYLPKGNAKSPLNLLSSAIGGASEKLNNLLG